MDTTATQFGRYRIEREIGRGAMGQVYLAEDTQLGRVVALKIPKKSALEEPEALERFYREARTTATLRHSHICPVYDVGAIDGVHYLTMAYIAGRPLSSYLGKGRTPTAKQTASLVRKVALALDEAHRNGIVHRDLKPSNVIIDDRGEPIVMDFGLACQLNTVENARLTQSGAILGTPAYMSPEQARGENAEIGPATDIYALGVMMYQLLTDELPFTGPVAVVFAQIITAEPLRPSALRPDVDAVLEIICLTMMSKEASFRHESMKEVAAALTEYLTSAPAFPVMSENASPTAEVTSGDAKAATASADSNELSPTLGQMITAKCLEQKAQAGEFLRVNSVVWLRYAIAERWLITFWVLIAALFLNAFVGLSWLGTQSNNKPGAATTTQPQKKDFRKTSGNSGRGVGGGGAGGSGFGG